MEVYQNNRRGIRPGVVRRLIHSIVLIACVALMLMPQVPGVVQAQQVVEALCFEETDYCIRGRIREFWEENGGLAVFGYPISPQRATIIEDKALEVQEFERNRLELHPENARPYDVLLGRLGVDRLEQQERDWTDFQKNTARDGCRFFPETEQNVCGVFLEMWRAHGLEIDGQPGKSEAESLALFGLPLSPPIIEEIEGEEYIVQWFERTRFESHPENDPPYHVLFGLLGNEVREFAEPAEDEDGTPTPDEDGTPTPDEDGTPTPDEDATPTPTPTPEVELGKIAFASDREGDREIFVINPDGTNLENITDHPAIDSTPAWSPDGTKIAFASERDGNREIYVMNADGSDQVRLTDNKGDDWNPVWSPDGWRIAFESDRNGNREVYVMSRDGSRQSALTNNPADDWSPSWSPDGTKIAFQSDRDGNREIYVMNDDGTGQTNLTDNIYTDERPSWSPDGTKIAFTSNRDGNREIYVMNPNGSGLVRLTNHPERDEWPFWSPDSTQIVFRSTRDGNGEIYIMDADGSDQTNITRNRANDREPVWWSPELDPQ